MLARAVFALALAGCSLHSKAERPRVALQNAAWLAGGAGLIGAGYAVAQGGPEDDGDSGLRGPTGAMLAGAGGVMAFGALLGLLGVAFDDVPE